MDFLKDWQTVAIIPAAGSGRRMNCPGKQKLLMLLHGQTVLIRTLKALTIPEIEAFFIPASASDREEFYGRIKAEIPDREVIFCTGGKERQDSIYSALTAVKAWQGWRVPEEQRMILIHDAARPLIEKDDLLRVLAAACQIGAAGLGVPVKDTIKVVEEDGLIIKTPERKNLWAIQTPQVFTWPVIWEAHTQARISGYTGTDDAALVEKRGHPVQMVPGSYRNLKITTPEDLAMAEALLGKEEKVMLRIGQGFDVHKLVSNRRLVLGGVEIPSPLGLEGHSDADVVIHAAMDALLGAAGLSDIGELFSDRDPAYKNIDSQRLLSHVMEKLQLMGVKPVNLDLTVIADYPKIAPYRQAMRSKLAALLKLPETEINIKGTTTEGLGFTGRREGVAAQAVALVKKTS